MFRHWFFPHSCTNLHFHSQAASQECWAKPPPSPSLGIQWGPVASQVRKFHALGEKTRHVKDPRAPLNLNLEFLCFESSGFYDLFRSVFTKWNNLVDFSSFIDARGGRSKSGEAGWKCPVSPYQLLDCLQDIPTLGYKYTPASCIIFIHIHISSDHSLQLSLGHAEQAPVADILLPTRQKATASVEVNSQLSSSRPEKRQLPQWSPFSNARTIPQSPQKKNRLGQSTELGEFAGHGLLSTYRIESHSASPKCFRCWNWHTEERTWFLAWYSP